jgi:hypothetical protein
MLMDRKTGKNVRGYMVKKDVLKVIEDMTVQNKDAVTSASRNHVEFTDADGIVRSYLIEQVELTWPAEE